MSSGNFVLILVAAFLGACTSAPAADLYRFHCRPNRPSHRPSWACRCDVDSYSYNANKKGCTKKYYSYNNGSVHESYYEEDNYDETESYSYSYSSSSSGWDSDNSFESSSYSFNVKQTHFGTETHKYDNGNTCEIEHEEDYWESCESISWSSSSSSDECGWWY